MNLMNLYQEKFQDYAKKKRSIPQDSCWHMYNPSWVEKISMAIGTID